MKTTDVKSLYYITHIKNIPSILEHGILSNSLVEQNGIPFTPIYDTGIVTGRRDRLTPDGKSLWQFANLYFQPRNPMLYRVIQEKNKNNLAILGVSPSVLYQKDSLISLGNPASPTSDILSSSQGLKSVLGMWNIINSEWWNPDDGSKRKIMAECLVPDIIPPSLIHTIYVANHESSLKVKDAFQGINVPIIPEPHMFFQPTGLHPVTDKLTLVEGDLFFSTMHTLTVSVNAVGIMGKGLASRAKYQFPDVYVVYQDACRKKRLLVHKPYLYKRESFLDEQLADDPFSLPNPNSNKWFLLFATKNHWKEKSDIEGIRAGLKWIQDNYKKENIKSLALPALGCGLGGLEWRDVGPLMCRYLAELDIPVAIYLPREEETAPSFLEPEFLLKER